MSQATHALQQRDYEGRTLLLHAAGVGSAHVFRVVLGAYGTGGEQVSSRFVHKPGQACFSLLARAVAPAYILGCIARYAVRTRRAPGTPYRKYMGGMFNLRFQTHDALNVGASEASLGMKPVRCC